MSTAQNPNPNQITQARHPVRAMLRTSVAFVVGIAPLAPLIYQQATQHNPEAATGWAAGSLALCALVTRVLAIPGLEEVLRKSKLTSWLAAAPPTSD